jgi:hypothetical protein
LIAPTELGSHFLVSYLDVSSPSCATVDGFTATALEQLGYITLSQYDTLTLVILEKAVKDLVSRNKIPILCLDEFEGFSNRQEFDLNFFTGLRAIAQIGLVLVAVSKIPVIDIVGKEGITSGFFNIFDQITLKPFNAEEAREFIQAKGTQAGFTDQEQARLLDYGRDSESQWSPVRLQLVGQMLLNDKRRAIRGNSNHYRPDDQHYWHDFQCRVEAKYTNIVREIDNDKQA